MVTTRDYAQTLELLQLHGIAHSVVGPRHGGARVGAKGRALVRRLGALRRFARERDFDVAFSHASHELALVARSLRVPSTYAFDYEFARVQHGLGARAANRVVVPDAIPQRRLDILGASLRKVRRYAGLKEEYYLAGFEPDQAVLDDLDVDPTQLLVVVRTAPEASLYHRHGSPVFADLLRRLGSDGGVQAVVLPRTAEQSRQIRALALPSLVVPDQAVDARSLIALADLVVSAGGTMNREAVALDVPAYTTFAGRVGAVDEMLVRQGRLRLLRSADELELVARKRAASSRTERDPALLLDLFLNRAG